MTFFREALAAKGGAIGVVVVAAALVLAAPAGCGGKTNAGSPEGPEGGAEAGADAAAPPFEAGADVLAEAPTDGPSPQDVVVEAPLRAAVPTYSPGPGAFSSPQSVTIATTTPGAMILYTLDGTNPNLGSLLYTAPISVPVTVQFRAYALAPGYQPSDVGAGQYDIIVACGVVSAPVADPAAGTYWNDLPVSLQVTTSGATICYTLDGSVPLATSAGSCVSPTLTYDTVKEISVDGAVTAPNTGSMVLTALGTLAGACDGYAPPMQYTLEVATPIISPASGAIAIGATVSFTTATTGAVTFHYTTERYAGDMLFAGYRDELRHDGRRGVGPRRRLQARLLVLPPRIGGLYVLSRLC